MSVTIRKGIVYRKSGGEYSVWKKGIHFIKSPFCRTIRINYKYTETQFNYIDICLWKHKIYIKDVDKLKRENEKLENTLYYIAGLIKEGNKVNEYAEINNFINNHLGKSEDDIISDMEYETEQNYIQEDDSYYEPKRKVDYL